MVTCISLHKVTQSLNFYNLCIVDLKIWLLVLPVFIVLFQIIVSVPYSDGRLQSRTILEQYVENETILVGKIIDAVEMENNHTLYNVEIERFIKNPQESKIIQVVGNGVKNSLSNTSVDKIFNPEDRVLLFLNTSDEKNIISPYSVNAETFNVDSDFILPPMRLYNAGIQIDDIVCKDSFVLVIKNSNGSPACVRENSLSKLRTFGWIQ